MENKDNKDFTPAVAIPPGETIKENMRFLGMYQEELATRLNITPKHLSNIMRGKAPVTYETAIKLEMVIGGSAQFWLNLETQYQLHRTRIQAQENLDDDLEILKQIPYKTMSDYGWVEETRERNKRVYHSRNFFGVSTLQAVKMAYAVAFRKHKAVKNISDYGIFAWLRKAEIEGLQIDVEPLNRKKLANLIPTFRALTLQDPSDFYPEMVRLCASCGIALVLVEYMPKTSICGATIWRNNRAIIALSNRGKRADIFWFTFFHELAHLLQHKSKELHINYDEESEADTWARNYLIPEEAYKTFLEKYPHNSKNAIVSYAHAIGIAPSILVGRLQHDKFLQPHYHNDLRPLFEVNNL